MEKLFILLTSVAALACSPSVKEMATDSTTVSNDSHISSARIPFEIPVLNVTQYKLYADKDTTVVFSEPSYLSDHEQKEPVQLKTDPRVKRIINGLEFKLNNGQRKILKEITLDSEDYVRYSFMSALDAINQWQVFATYYEGYGFILINQNDGRETPVWSEPFFSSDKKFFLTSSVDLEAAFVPTGFQLFSFQKKELIKHWEKELSDWGAESLIWDNPNYVIGRQIFYDDLAGEYKKRIIKLPIHWRLSENQ